MAIFFHLSILPESCTSERNLSKAISCYSGSKSSSVKSFEYIINLVILSTQTPSLLTDNVFIPAAGTNADSTSSLTSNQQVVIEVPVSGGTSTITIPVNTVISSVNGGNFNANTSTAASVASGFLSGLGIGVVVDGSLQWGIADLGLQFSSPITINIYVGAAFNGQVLSIVRSVSGSGGWTADGIVSPATCTVSNGLCAFTATKASYYAAIHTTSTGSTGGGGGGGGGGGLPPGLTISNTTTVETTETSVTITWSTSYASTSQVIYALATENHSLDLSDNSGTPPHYGYTRTTPETDVSPKVVSHSVTITGLSAGTTYYYRTVSHGSLAISQEYAFITKGVAGTTTEEEWTGDQENQKGFGLEPGQENIPGSGELAVTPLPGQENPEIAPEESPFLPVASESPAAAATGREFLAAVGLAPFNSLKLLLTIILLAGAGFAVSFLLKKRRKS
jgi:hypothetical protein